MQIAEVGQRWEHIRGMDGEVQEEAGRKVYSRVSPPSLCRASSYQLAANAEYPTTPPSYGRWYCDYAQDFLRGPRAGHIGGGFDLTHSTCTLLCLGEHSDSEPSRRADAAGVSARGFRQRPRGSIVTTPPAAVSSQMPKFTTRSFGSAQDNRRLLRQAQDAARTNTGSFPPRQAQDDNLSVLPAWKNARRGF
jgi:hypothetical protein